MKNRIFPILAFCCTLAFASCKQKEQTCLLGKVFLSDGSSSPAPNTFLYYGDGRLQKIHYANGNTDTLFYNNDSLHLLTFDNQGALLSDLTGTTTPDGSLQEGTKTYYGTGGTTTAVDTYRFTYNPSGNLTHLLIANATATTTITYDYADGNRLSGTLTSDNTLQEQYRYFHNTAGNKSQLYDDDGVFMPYRGVPSKNLLDSLWIIAGTDTTRVIYSYQLDHNGYVTSSVRAQRNPQADSRYTVYSYFDCRE